MKKISFILLCMIIASYVLVAQDAPSKFGKINENDLKATICPIDSNAHAYFIFDCGETSFTYPQATIRADDHSSNSGFVMNTKRHFRIKFIDASALDYGNIEIDLYVSGSTEEKLADLDAVSFNIENGKTVKSKFEKKNLIYEERSKNWKSVKIPMPNVKAGTVIDVKYSVQSRFYFNLRNWKFQYPIPVLYSNYTTIVPEYFNYHRNIKGYIAIKSESGHKRNTIRFTEVDNGWGAGLSGSTNGSASGRSTYNYNVEFEETVNTYLGENIPAFVEDSYLKTPDNYTSEAEFELAYTKFPGAPIKNHTMSWEGVLKDLMQDDDFGVKLNRNDFFDDYASVLKTDGKSKEELISSATKYISSHIKWNEYNRVYLSKSLRKVFEDGVGNSSDINLCLVALLNKLGIESYPVVLSTQRNGALQLTHPTISAFNYVIAYAKIDDKYFMIDATDPLLEINQLPIRCLNDKGLIVKAGAAEWVDLMAGAKYKKQTSFQLQIDSDFTLKGKFVSKLDNHAAYLERLDIREHNNNDSYIRETYKNAPGLEIDSSSISGYDTLSKPLYLDCNITLSNAIETTGTLAFISPFLYETTKQSPFKLEDRTYPVEFDYPAQVMITAQYEIPENMTVESLPQAVSIVLSDKSAKYAYNASQLGNKVVVTSLYNRSKTLYIPGEYSDLKEFYRKMIAKQNEKIVLKLK
ncbi:MAG: hypothetical protein AB7S48_13800 [Bacteroidales bacterium]